MDYDSFSYGESCTPIKAKIIDIGDDRSGNLLIEFKRQQMELNQRAQEINELKRQLRTKSEIRTETPEDTKDALIETLRSEVDRLEAYNHHLKTIMSMERLGDQFTIDESNNSSASAAATNAPDSENSVIRHYIKHDVSTVDVQRISVDTKKSILPARWTRSMQNLKAPQLQHMRKSASCSQMSAEDTIDQLESQVSQLQFSETSAVLGSASYGETSAGPGAVLHDAALHEASPQSHDTHTAPTFSPPTASPLKGRRSLFKEDFSADCTESINLSSRRWSDPIEVLEEFSVALGPQPRAESTFISKQQYTAGPMIDPSEMSIGQSVTRSLGQSRSMDPTSFSQLRAQAQAQGNDDGSAGNESVLGSLPMQRQRQRQRLPKSKSIAVLAVKPAPVEPPRAPRNIMQLVTQVFVGEYMEKQVSGLRGDYTHKRYFWVHPYTLTLYWSKEKPAAAIKGWHKAKSIQIMRISEEVVTSNSVPFHKTLVVHSPRRAVKITCADHARHTVWMRALTHLLEASKKTTY